MIEKILTIVGAILLLLHTDSAYAQQSGKHPIGFRSSSEVLSPNYENNANEIASIKQFITQYEDVILTGNGHIRLVAPIGHTNQKENLATINLAATRAANTRNFLRKSFRMLTHWSFTFYLDSTRVNNNTIEVHYIPHAIPASVSSTIYYTKERNSARAVQQEMSKYGALPYLSNAPAITENSSARAPINKINAIATNPVNVDPIEGEPNPEKLLIAIHYRWDKANLDKLYLSNPENLHLLDSVLTSINVQYIDTLTIVAFASPEGQPAHNRRLSERRAQTIKNYIIDNYRLIAPERIVTEARGENWDGLRKLAINDPNLPSRNEILKIVDSPLTSLQKQSRLTQLDGGVTYYRYILPNYYRYLRNGASVLIAYSPDLPVPLPPMPMPKIKLPFDPVPEPELTLIPIIPPMVRYPIALRTNLLYDAVGALNIGVEIPIRRHFSAIADFAYSYWRSRKNLYALQTLEGGVEGRYWFSVKEEKKQKNPEWAKPLRGWNVGVYGMYCSRYDVQWVDGYQGDGFWSAGLTAGYAMPIARNLTLELSLGAGYFYTSEYRHYHQPEYDANGKYHLMWQQTGNFGTFTLTKVRVSLVWLFSKTKKGGFKWN